MQGNNLTGAVSFPDFQIPSNPKYVKMFVNKSFSEEKKRKHMELLFVGHRKG